MNLKSIGISNFKAFGKEFQTVPIKPITLVFGPNSAGKSSLLHSLLWLNHVVHTGDCDVNLPRASLGNVNLGGFRQIRHRHKTNESIIFSLVFPCDIPVPSSANTKGSPATQVELKLAYGEANTVSHDSIYNMVASRLLIDGKTFLRSRGGAVTEFDLKNPLFSKAIENLTKSSQADDESIQNFLSELVEKQVFTLQTVNGLPSTLGYDFLQLTFSVGDNSFISFKQAGEFIKEVLQASEPIIGKVYEAAKNGIGKLAYLPPIRELPPRDFDPSKRPEEAWREIARNLDLIPRLNQWLGNDKMLGTGYRLENRAFLPTESIQKRSPDLLKRELWNLLTKTNFATDAAYLMEQAELEFRSLDPHDYLHSHLDFYESRIADTIGCYGDDTDDRPQNERIEWARSVLSDMIDYDDAPWIWDHYLDNYQPLAEFLEEKWSISEASRRLSSGIETECKDRKYELSLVEKSSGTRLALQDVGFGISQFLPVLIHSFGSKNQLIVIEQPEIHIHPRLQAELGDVFIESALGANKNTFLLETHSEHLILRILRRIRETTEGDTTDWPEALRNACPNGIRPEDVAVLYVQPGYDGSEVIEMPVDAHGEFTCEWPGGFFEERLKEFF